MAVGESVRSITAIAGEDLSTTPFRFCVFNSSGVAVKVSAAQGDVDGVCLEGVASGKDFALAVPDGCVVPVEAGAAVTRGALVASDTTGRVIAHVAAVDNVACGRALQAAAAAGEIIKIQFVHKRVDAGT